MSTTTDVVHLQELQAELPTLSLLLLPAALEKQLDDAIWSFVTANLAPSERTQAAAIFEEQKAKAMLMLRQLLSIDRKGALDITMEITWRKKTHTLLKYGHSYRSTIFIDLDEPKNNRIEGMWATVFRAFRKMWDQITESLQEALNYIASAATEKLKQFGVWLLDQLLATGERIAATSFWLGYKFKQIANLIKGCLVALGMNFDAQEITDNTAEDVFSSIIRSWRQYLQTKMATFSTACWKAYKEAGVAFQTAEEVLGQLFRLLCWAVVEWAKMSAEPY